MQRIDFFKLSREKQERFIASTRGAAPPAPILARYGASGRARVFAAVSAGALVFFAIMLVLGFGSLTSSLSVHKAHWLAVYAALLFLIPFGVMTALGLRREAKGLRYKAGWYAFPMTLVDARSKVLRVFPMTDLVTAAPGEGGFVLTLKGAGAITFPFGDGETGPQVSQQIEIARANTKHAVASQDESELVTLDPLYEAKKGWSSPIGPKEPLKDTPPTTKRLAPIVSLGVAVVLGPLFWFSHNAASEDAMLKKAKALDTPDAYGQYLALGDRHADDVSRVLLPRAQLKDAKAQGTVEAMQAFLASHPNSAIDQEAQAALHDAYAVELDKAKKVGTVTALAAFAQKYPQHGMPAELAKAKHVLYDAVLAKWKAHAPTTDPALLGFVTRLLAFLEKSGPTVRVALLRELTPGLERADKVLGDNPLNRGRGTKQVTRWFDGNPPATSADVVNALAGTFDDVFPKDMLVLASVPSATDEAVAALKEAAIVIRLRVSWLGAAYYVSSTTMKRAFAGVTVSGDATGSIPGDPTPFRVRIDVGAGGKLLLDYDSPVHPNLKLPIAMNADAPEQGVYAIQELRAIDLSIGVVERAFFKKEKH